jgi:hypothetical protein
LRQFRGDDFVRVGVDAGMQLPPATARPAAMLLIQPFAFAVNLQATAVDQEMQRLVVVDPLRQDCQPAATTTQSGMVRDGDIDPKRGGD